MSDLAARLALKEQLPRAWPAFFERHGAFTAAQEATIPALLAGHDALVVAPTASGKTEAVLAPLVERYCTPGAPGPAILYLAPTRALVNDLAARLHGPMDTLGLRLAVRTGDRSTLRTGQTPDLLISTPESLDALLASRARLFASLHAVAVDELHLLDGTPRGDHLRVLLARLRRLRAYAVARGDAHAEGLQVVALSATVERPAAIAARYCRDARVIVVGGGRALDAELLPLASEGVGELRTYLRTFRPRGWRKALVFCNTRAEVEAYAAAVREDSPFGGAVYVHYANIEARQRRETEERFAADGAAILFATSTLELGIDIGNVDAVILIGPPGSPASFMQRVGRGNRRKGVTHVACFYRDPLEYHLFEALLADALPMTMGNAAPTGSAGVSDSPTSAAHRASTRSAGFQPATVVATASAITTSPLIEVSRLEAGAPSEYDTPLFADASRRNAGAPSRDGDAPFRPAVAVQQIFSLLKASPTAAVRQAELSALLTGLLPPGDLGVILDGLHGRGYLATGRPGDWVAGPRLDELFDKQGRKNCPLSIYSNIEGMGGRVIEVRDRDTGALVASVDPSWLDRPVLTLQGRPVTVEWQDGEALWVTGYRGQDVAGKLTYRSRGQLFSHDLARLLPTTLGLPIGTAPLVPSERGLFLFHWLGDVYGYALFGLLRYRIYARETARPGLCIELDDEPRALSAWTEETVEQYCADDYRQLEPMLALGPYQHLLPTDLRRRAVIAQFDVPRFRAAIASLRVVHAPEGLSENLLEMVGD